MNRPIATQRGQASLVFIAAGSVLCLRVLLVVLPALVSACTPAYNWREIRATEEGFQVMLPARPVSMSQPIQLDGLEVTMSMIGARVDETLFTVGAVVLPDALPATREKATAAMRAGMVRNLHGHETDAATVEVPVVDAAGRPVANATASRIEVEGRIAERPAHMSATFVSRGDRAWQAVMIGRSIDAETARRFHDSFRIAE